MTSCPVPSEEFAEVALSYLNQLYGVAQRLSRNAADAEDLVQDTYHLAFQRYRELRSLTHCRAWLHRILRRQAVTRYRRERARPPLVGMAGGSDDDASVPEVGFDGDLLERIALREIAVAIDGLPADLRAAVRLCDIEGFSYAEIAAMTDCPVGTVRSRIARARGKLMTKLRAQAEECGIRQRTSSVAR